jgi:hypothetical protein
MREDAARREAAKVLCEQAESVDSLELDEVSVWE